MGVDTGSLLHVVISRWTGDSREKREIIYIGTRESYSELDALMKQFDVHTCVSYISQYVTLLPGDVIYTGTPGSTRAFKAGDVIEVELEGVGILRNRAAAAIERD